MLKYAIYIYGKSAQINLAKRCRRRQILHPLITPSPSSVNKNLEGRKIKKFTLAPRTAFARANKAAATKQDAMSHFCGVRNHFVLRRCDEDEEEVEGGWGTVKV